MMILICIFNLVPTMSCDVLYKINKGYGKIMAGITYGIRALKRTSRDTISAFESVIVGVQTHCCLKECVLLNVKTESYRVFELAVRQIKGLLLGHINGKYLFIPLPRDFGPLVPHGKFKHPEVWSVTNRK